MYYHICIMNCLEDWYRESKYIGQYATLEEAIEYANNNAYSFPVFNVKGYIHWYFQSCESDGILHNPDKETDRLECYQLICIIPSEEDDIWYDELYSYDPRSVYNMYREYLLYYTGEYKNYRLEVVELEDEDDEYY